MGAGKRGLDRRPVADIGIDAYISGTFLPHHRRARFGRRAGADHRRQFRVVHRDQRRRVRRRIAALGHHHGDRLTGIARLVVGQGVVVGDEDLRSVAVLEQGVGRRGRHRHMRDAPHSIGVEIGAGQHRDYSRCGQGGGGVVGFDPRVRIGRAHHRRMGLAGERHVVAETARTGQQPHILLAQHRCADHGIHVRRPPRFLWLMAGV